MQKTCVVCKTLITGDYYEAKVHDGRPPATKNRWRIVGHCHERCLDLVEKTCGHNQLKETNNDTHR